MKFVFLAVALFAALVWWMLYGEPRHTDTLIAHLPIDAASDVSKAAARSGAEFDPAISSDGRGSLRIDSDSRAFLEIGRVWGDQADVSFRRLIYQAEVRTENVQGPVFLVMQAGIAPGPPDGMPVVGRDQAISGTHDWTTVEVSAGNPANTLLMETTLQLQVDGPGKVWIDDVRLISRQVH
jgi:hypothetical protein